MKLVHLSDLHIGKRVNEYSMIDDQAYILNEIIDIIDEKKPDGVIIAGDVYDKPIPSAEAVQLFDDFLFKLLNRKIHVFIISGNHDSPERLAFGSRIMNEKIHIAQVYNGCVKPVELTDDYGKVNVYMLPFVKPVNVRSCFPDEEINSYDDAVSFAVKNMNINFDERNVLVTHQFVTGANRCESEEISVGGSDNIDASIFDEIDYVALGHIHGPQNIGCERIRYCGSPLKYSFSETNHKKSVTLVELKEKNNIKIETIPLIPRCDMKEIKGKYEDLTKKSFYENTSYNTDYVHITLTDEEDIPDAVIKLRTIYHNLMRLDYDNKRTRNMSLINTSESVENKSPFDLFSEFYREQNGSKMKEEQIDYIQSLIEKIWGNE